MKLNRTGSIWNRDERNKINDNWDKLEGNVNNLQNEITDKVFAEIKDSAKLNWGEPVNSFSDLPSNAKNGETRFTRDTGKVYRYDGKNWIEIQEIDAGPVNELDSRLKTMLAETDDEIFKSSLVNHKVKGFNVWWIDDDGHKGVYTKLAPILREYGIKMSSAVITNRPHGFPIAGLPSHSPNSSFMSYNQMKELEEEGIVEFIPHSHTHDLNHRYTDMTVDEIHDDMSQCKSIMRQLGWNYKDLVFPFGSHNAQVREVARQYFRSSIDIKGGAFIPPVNQFMLPRLGMDNRSTQEIIDEINIAHEKDTLIILMSHVDQYGGLEESKMRVVIEHVHSLGGEFITSEEAIGNYGNLLQVGDDSISYDGEIHGKNIGVYRNGHTDFSPNANITEFAKGTVTRNKVRQFELEAYSLPEFIVNEGGYGYIEVHRDSTEDVFSYREFTNVKTGMVLLSKWETSVGEWGEWSYVGGEVILPSNSRKGDEVPDKYPQGVVSVVFINDANATGTPDFRGGTLKTYRLTSDDSGVYQEHKFISSNNKYTRRWISSQSKWGEWEQIGFHTYVLPDTFNSSSVPNSFPERRITTLFIRDANADGFPENRGGILTMFNLSTDNTFRYQEYKIRNSNNKYIRTWTSSGWGEFELM